MTEQRTRREEGTEGIILFCFIWEIWAIYLLLFFSRWWVNFLYFLVSMFYMFYLLLWFEIGSAAAIAVLLLLHILLSILNVDDEQNKIKKNKREQNKNISAKMISNRLFLCVCMSMRRYSRGVEKIMANKLFSPKSSTRK